MRPGRLYRTPNLLGDTLHRLPGVGTAFSPATPTRRGPDCARDGQLEAWSDAAELVDDKWERAFAKADEVRRGFAVLLDDADGGYALAPNTHDLLLRFLSALPLRRRPRLVTTDGEFHSIRRQLDRLGEEGIAVKVKVAADPPPPSPSARRRGGRQHAAVLVSAVFFHNAHVVPGLASLGEPARTTARNWWWTPTTPSAWSRSPSRMKDWRERSSREAATSTASSGRGIASSGCRRAGRSVRW